MRKAEVRWWIAALAVIFVGTMVFNILGQEGGLAYFMYSLDATEILGVLFLGAVGTLFTVWHASVLLGLLFIIGLLLVLSRSGRLGAHMPSIALFVFLIAAPCLLLWNLTRQHLPTLGGISLSLFWISGPVILYLCMRHAIIRRNETWSTRDRRIAYLGASVTLLVGSLSVGTIKSDAEVARSLDRGREVVYAIKHFQQQNRKLPETLQELVPAYFSSLPETDVPEGWRGREPYVYTKAGERRFAVSFKSASYLSCGYERARDSWECR